MSPHLTISDNRDDPGNPLLLGGEAIDGAAKAPLTIGQLMVDQVWLEGTDPTGGALYYERGSNTHRRLQAFETGHEAMMTGGWVRVLWAPSRCERSASAWSGPPPTAWCACMASTAACCWWSFWIGLGGEAGGCPCRWPPEGSTMRSRHGQNRRLPRFERRQPSHRRASTGLWRFPAVPPAGLRDGSARLQHHFPRQGWSNAAEPPSAYPV